MIIINQDSFEHINESNFKAYAKRYIDIERHAISAIEDYGLPFDTLPELQQRNQQLRQQLKQRSVIFANNNKSIHSRWLSDACRACRTGEGSYTTFLSLKCHRNCYFCFNPNQDNYTHFTKQQRNTSDELKEIAAMSIPLTHIALTGGEPLLYREECIAFFKQANHLFPNVHSRLYTAGDPLNQATAQQLKEAGLQEIRFSIKIDDPPKQQENILRRIAIARRYIANVMVEMPVLPGTKQQMCDLLLKLDEIGIDGINLLEFCFPFNNADIYQQHGFKLKYPPYEVFYNYWYAGGLAIAESENLCLELLLFALDNKLKMGVHYCSLENKHTGQIFQQNQDYSADETYLFSTLDYFFKTAKVFGEARYQAKSILQQQGITFRENHEHAFLQFNPKYISFLAPSDMEICLSSSVIEQDNNTFFIKEVQLAKTSPATFNLSDIQEIL